MYDNRIATATEKQLQLFQVSTVLEELLDIIEADLDRACYNEELKEELHSLPPWQLSNIFDNVIANAGYGQRTIVRQRITGLQIAIRDVTPASSPYKL